MIDVKSDKGEFYARIYGNPAQINAELSVIVEHVVLSLSDSIPELIRKPALQMFLDAIYNNVSKEIEKL